MTVVAVGFFPAGNPGPVTGAASAAPQSAQSAAGGQGGVFAALLALIGRPQPAETTAGVTGTGQAATQPTIPGVTFTAPADAATATEPGATTQLTDVAAAQTPKGKSLLKHLGDALIALNDALEDGKPVDPALEKKLGETLDAAVAYFGITAPTPAQPAIDPRIFALASGEGVLPSISAAALPASGQALPAEAAPMPPADATKSADAAAPADQPVESTASFEPAAVPAPVPTDAVADAITSALPGGDTVAKVIKAVASLFETPAAQAEPVETAAPGDIASTPAPSPEEHEAEVPASHPELNRLAKLVEGLADKVAPAAPELAKKLDALATGLEAAAGPDGSEADPAPEDADVARIIEALGTPKPAATKAAEQQAFTAPALDLPEAVAPRDKTADASPQPVDTQLAASDSVDPSPVEAKKPALTAHGAAEARPSTGNDPAPAPQASPAAATDTASTPAPAPNSAQPAAPIARTIHAAYQAPVQQVNLPQVAFEVVRQFDAGNSRFQIRLDPPELGRIDVKLDVDKSGTVNARMTVERAETLDLMQRDQRALQQALQQAGLDSSRTNLEFSLRQNPFAAQGGMGDGRGQQQPQSGGGTLASDEPAVDTVTTLYRGTASASGVNLFV